MVKLDDEDLKGLILAVTADLITHVIIKVAGTIAEKARARRKHQAKHMRQATE